MIHPGLPNDQYHAWLDPIIFAAFGVAVAWMWAARPKVVKAAAVTVLVACLTLSIVSMPSFASAPGGWPSAATAADRIRAVTDDKPTAVTGVYKSGAAVEFPLRRAGSTVVDPSAAEFLVVTCDPLFERAVGIPCGGPAEAARAFMAGLALAETRVASPMVRGETSASSVDGDTRLPRVPPTRAYARAIRQRFRRADE